MAKRKTKKKAAKKRASKKKPRAAKRKPAKRKTKEKTPEQRLEFARRALNMAPRLFAADDIDGAVNLLVNAFYEARTALKVTKSQEAYNLAYDAEKALRERLLQKKRNPQTAGEKRKRRERIDAKSILRGAMRGT